MGQAVAAVVEGRGDADLFACFDRPGAQDARLVDRASALAAAQVVIDFSTPKASVELAQVCAAQGGMALVIGSTGFDAEQIAAIDKATQAIPIVRAMSKICSGDVSGKAGHLVSASWATTSPVLESTIG